MQEINIILQLVSNITSIVIAYLGTISERMRRAGRHNDLRNDALLKLGEGSIEYLKKSSETYATTIDYSNAQELCRQTQKDYFSFQHLFYDPMLSGYPELETFRDRACRISVKQSNAIIDACNRSHGKGSKPLNDGCMEELTELVTEMKDFIGKQIRP